MPVGTSSTVAPPPASIWTSRQEGYASCFQIIQKVEFPLTLPKWMRGDKHGNNQFVPTSYPVWSGRSPKMLELEEDEDGFFMERPFSMNTST